MTKVRVYVDLREGAYHDFEAESWVMWADESLSIYKTKKNQEVLAKFHKNHWQSVMFGE